MVLVPIRNDNAYVGLGLQAAQGTAVAPTLFPRWMDGTSLELDLKAEDVWEGDGSRRLSLIIKNMQQAKFKLHVTPRPIEQGFFERAALGIAADAITTATPSTTTTTTITGGTSTSVSVASGTGLSGSGTIQMLVDAGTTNAEVVTFSLPIATLTLTVAASYNGGKFKNNHSSGATIAALTSVNTSATSPSVAGASSLIVGNNNGLGSFPITLAVSEGTASEEFVTFSAIAGTGPYTLTVANTYNGGTMLNAHSSGDVVSSPVLHAETDQYDGSYYTIEVGLGSLSGQGGITLRIRDCKLDTIKRSGKSGSLLIYEMEFSGLVSVVQGSPSTVLLENHLPILFQNGVWTLDGSTTGDALDVQEFDISQKNSVSVVQTEGLTGAAIIFGRITVDVTIKIVYQASTTFIQKTYMGGASGTTDAQQMWSGSLSLQFTSLDNFNTLLYKILTLLYTKASLPEPKVDGKEYTMSLNASSISNMGQNAYLLQSTVGNTYAQVY